MWFKRIVAAIFCAVLAGQVNASSLDIPSAYVRAANANGIPPALLYAVASAESVMSLQVGRRPWPWTLNVAGEGMRFHDRSSACHALRDALKHTRVVDIGIAQLNFRWQPQLFGVGQRFEDPCAGLDPYANLDEAAGLIRQHYDASGDWLVAAGRYHRPAGGEPAERYREIVRKELLRLGNVDTAQFSTSGDEVTQALASRDASAPSTSQSNRNLTWITPSPRSSEKRFTWITPSPRQWMTEVASR